VTTGRGKDERTVDFGAKLLMVLHGAAAVVLIGSSTHNGVLAVAHLMGRPLRRKLRRLHAKITTWAYSVAFLMGLIIYPAFRLDVREAYLDEHLPLATGFFEVKEHWLALGFIIVLAHYTMSRGLDVRERSADAVLYDCLGIALSTVVWFSFFVGMILVAIRPLGGV
jgi:hypothetical protein